MNIIWIHGFGEDYSVWNDFILKIKTPFRSHLYEHASTSNYTTIKEYAEDLRNYIVTNEINSPVLIGHSMGGYIALEYAALYPNSILGLGLFHSSAAADTEAKKNERRKTMDFISKNGTSTFIRNFYPNMFTEFFRKEHADLVEENIKRFEKLSQNGLLSAIQSMINRNDHLKTLAELNFPVFQILGKNDTFIPLEKALEQTLLLQNPYTLILDNVAHAGMYESPDICADFIMHYFSTLYK
jgi:pimeloyl-ACP methyl ester carboxylesterase